MRFPVLGLLSGLILLGGCDIVPGPTVPFPKIPTKTGPTPDPEPEPPPPAPAPPPPAPAPPPPTPPSTSSSLTGLGNPFADVYPAAHIVGKGDVHDLATVDGRLYLAHGSTNSNVVWRPVYYDLGSEGWASDNVQIRQEGIFEFQVGPSGRLYATADDPQGVNAVLMIRRERNGSWTERVVDTPENHSRDTYEWVDPKTGKTLVFVHNPAPHYPDVSISYDGGGSFVRYGEQSHPSGTNPIGLLKFFEFKGELYASSYKSSSKPYLSRYTGDSDDPFEVVSANRASVFPGGGSQIDKAATFGDHLVVASNRFYAGTALRSDRMVELNVPGRAKDMVQVGDEMYLLSANIGPGTSNLYVTRDGVTVSEVETFDRPFVAIEYVDGAFYLAESGGVAQHTLWRYTMAR